MNMIDWWVGGGSGEGCPGEARGYIIRRDFTNLKGMILLSLDNIRTSIALFPWSGIYMEWIYMNKKNA